MSSEMLSSIGGGRSAGGISWQHVCVPDTSVLETRRDGSRPSAGLKWTVLVFVSRCSVTVGYSYGAAAALLTGT
jgi:hypothetical protein